MSEVIEIYSEYFIKTLDYGLHSYRDWNFLLGVWKLVAVGIFYKFFSDTKLVEVLLQAHLKRMTFLSNMYKIQEKERIHDAFPSKIPLCIPYIRIHAPSRSWTVKYVRKFWIKFVTSITICKADKSRFSRRRQFHASQKSFLVSFLN